MYMYMQRELAVVGEAGAQQWPEWLMMVIYKYIYIFIYCIHIYMFIHIIIYLCVHVYIYIHNKTVP